MSHVRTLNLLNNKAIVPQTPKQSGETQTTDDRFTRLFQTLRTEANRSSERVSRTRRTGGARAHQSSDRIEHDRPDRADGHRTESTGAEDGRLEERDRAQRVRGDGPDAQPENRRPENPSPTDDSRDHSTEPGRPSAEPTDRSDRTGQSEPEPPQNTESADASSGSVATDQPAEAPHSQAQQGASGANTTQGQGTGDAQGQGTSDTQAQGTSDTQGRAAQGPPTDAQQAAILLAQLRQEGAGRLQTGGQNTSTHTGGPRDGSAAAAMPKTMASASGQSAAQPLPLTGGQAAAAEGPAPGGNDTAQARSVPAAANPTGAGVQVAQAVNAGGDRPVGGAASDKPSGQTGQDRQNANGPGTETSAEQDHSAMGRRGQPVARRGPSATKSAEPELTPLQARPRVAETAKAPDTMPEPNRPVGGHVTRMWTGPVRGDPTASNPPTARADQQHQALAVEATRQMARFLVEPKGAGEPSVQGREPQPTQSAQPSGSSGVNPTGPSAPSVSPDAASELMRPPVVVPSSGSGRAGQTSALGDTGSSAPAPDTSAQENVDRIVRVLRAHVGTRESQVRIQLEPPELGRVRIDIRMRNDTLFLNVETETAAGRDLLNSRLGQLRDALQQHGIVIERANVQMRDAVSETPQTREQQQQPSQHPNQNQNQGAPGQPADQSQDSERRDGPAHGEDVPAPASSSEPDGSGEADASVDAAVGGGVDGSGGEPSAMESRVDLVA